MKIPGKQFVTGKGKRGIPNRRAPAGVFTDPNCFRGLSYLPFLSRQEYTSGKGKKSIAILEHRRSAACSNNLLRCRTPCFFVSPAGIEPATNGLKVSWQAGDKSRKNNAPGLICRAPNADILRYFTAFSGGFWSEYGAKIIFVTLNNKGIGDRC